MDASEKLMTNASSFTNDLPIFAVEDKKIDYETWNIITRLSVRSTPSSVGHIHQSQQYHIP